MRNRAKCRLCEMTIESFHRYDYVTCKCGEISISGGLETYECAAKNFDNFLRINDEGEQISVKVKDRDMSFEAFETRKKEDLLKLLEDMMYQIQMMPPEAMQVPITHYDHYQLLMLLSELFKLC